MSDELPWCSILEEDDLIPQCMVLVYRDEEYLIREETCSDGWCQVVITCSCCQCSETWVEEE